MNRLELTGTLLSKPKEAVSKTGKTFCTFDLNVGEHIFGLCAFGKNKSLAMQCREGDTVSVLGELSQRKYTDKTGNERTLLQVYIKEVVKKVEVRNVGGGEFDVLDNVGF